MRKYFKDSLKRSSAGMLLFALLAVMIMAASVHKAYAYFTTYATARGGYTIKLGDTTTTNEKFSDWKKHIVITSGKDSKPVYVRARAFCKSEYSLDIKESGSWTDRTSDDGYYYYDKILNAGEKTDELIVAINNVPKSADVTSPESFNVIIVYETTPVLYDTDGNPYADWTGEVDATTVTAND